MSQEEQPFPFVPALHAHINIGGGFIYIALPSWSTMMQWGIDLSQTKKFLFPSWSIATTPTRLHPTGPCLRRFPCTAGSHHLYYQCCHCPIGSHTLILPAQLCVMFKAPAARITALLRSAKLFPSFSTSTPTTLSPSIINRLHGEFNHKGHYISELHTLNLRPGCFLNQEIFALQLTLRSPGKKTDHLKEIFAISERFRQASCLTGGERNWRCPPAIVRILFPNSPNFRRSKNSQSRTRPIFPRACQGNNRDRAFQE